MGRVKIPYYVVKKDHGYWQPTPTMRAHGFVSIRCGKDGPAAWTIAGEWNERWQRHRRGIEEDTRPRWPPKSFGDAFDRYRRTDEWSEKKPRTREEWERGFARIAPVFGDMSPLDPDVSLETLSAFRRRIADLVSPREAWRTIKIWRALWNVVAAMGYAGAKRDPSRGIRNRQPAARSQRWYEGEAVRLVKRAWREGYHGLAAAIACSWDTMLSPVDVRGLTAEQRRGDGVGIYFVADRTKTGAGAIGTLSRRGAAILDAYLAREPVEIGPLFRNRSGRAYSRFTLPDDFAVIRELEFPGDSRTLADMRRSGAMEARAGQVDPATLSAKMANTIATSNALHRAYQPVDLTAVRAADFARRVGRRATSNGNESAPKVGTPAKSSNSPKSA